MTSVSEKFKSKLADKEAEKLALEREAAAEAERQHKRDRKTASRNVAAFLKESLGELDTKIAEAFEAVASGETKNPEIVFYSNVTYLPVADIQQTKAYKEFAKACKKRDIAFDLECETREIGTIYCEGTWEEKRLALSVYPAISPAEFTRKR